MIENRLIRQNSLKTVKKQCDQIEARGKRIYFNPATWADHLSNFLVLFYFSQMKKFFFKTKIFILFLLDVATLTLTYMQTHTLIHSKVRLQIWDKTKCQNLQKQ